MSQKTKDKKPLKTRTRSPFIRCDSSKRRAGVCAMKQSKALLKLGVATDLGTAVRTSPGKSDSVLPNVKSKKKVETTTTTETKLLQDYIVLNPKKNLDLKSWTRILAEKIQKEIEEQAASQKKPSYTVTQPEKQQRQQTSAGRDTPSRSRSSALPKSSAIKLAKIPEVTPTQTPVGRGATGASFSNLGPTLFHRGNKKPQTATSTTSTEGYGGDDNNDNGTVSSVVSSPSPSPLLDVDTREESQSRRSTARTGEAATTAGKTADQTSEIDLLDNDIGEEAYQCMKQSKPMVLNLDNMMESTIEVLEYESERPLDLPDAEESY